MVKHVELDLRHKITRKETVNLEALGRQSQCLTFRDWPTLEQVDRKKGATHILQCHV
jgi:hypothetical protein